MENKIFKLTDQDFSDLVKSSLNISEVLFKLGYSTKGNSWGYSQIKQRMEILGLSGKDFRGKSAICIKNENKKIDQKKLFCENSKHSRRIVRKYILQNKLLPYKCSICGITKWNGKTLSLELDHINGINNDNRLTNLRFLCPNCHSQTTTYGARNKQCAESKFDLSQELKNLIINEYIKLKSIDSVSKKYNLKLKAIKQVLSEAGLTKPNQKYVIQYDSNHKEIKRFGSIAECCKWLISNNVVKTKLLKTCKNTLKRNFNSLWNNYYFELLDA